MATFYQLDFEKPVVELEQQIEAAENRLKQAVPGDASATAPVDPLAETIRADLAGLQARRTEMLREVYSKLTPWQTVRVARHPERPQTRDYIAAICRDFQELHGDRRYGDDPAIVCGFARIGPHKAMLVGHQKGKETAEKLACHFGCAHPEGYRKALAKMRLAAKYGVPIVSLVDTPGAYPGLGAEQRGQAEAIAVNMLEMSRLPTPIVSIIIGEGGSGGALAISVSDVLLMLQYSVLSVITPEGCAAILWRSADRAPDAAETMGITAHRLKALGLIDRIVNEPVGGAHRDPQQMAQLLKRALGDALRQFQDVKPADLVKQRLERIMAYGKFQEIGEER